jgi:hypothetical protein
MLSNLLKYKERLTTLAFKCVPHFRRNRIESNALFFPIPLYGLGRLRTTLYFALVARWL